MGEQAAVNSKVGAVNAKSTTRPLRLGIDVPMLITVAFLLGFGILMVYSASWQPRCCAVKVPPTIWSISLNGQ